MYHLSWLAVCWCRTTYLPIHINPEIINQTNRFPISLYKYIKNGQTDDCNVKTSNGSFFYVWWKIMFKVKYIFQKMKRIISIFCIYLIKSEKISFCKTSLSLSSSVRRLLLQCCKYKIKSFITKLKLYFTFRLFRPVWSHWN